MKLSERQQHILQAVIQEHLVQGKPVGSQQLVTAGGFDVSSATMRNEMAELEEKGFLTHPHTSAGRIPTEQGWRYYLDHIIEKKELSKKEESYLQQQVKSSEPAGPQKVKTLAKALAELSEEAIMIGFAPNDVYYTGLRNLFSKPEFQDFAVVTQLSEVIDHLDEALSRLFLRKEKSQQDVTVLVGQEHPFGADCSVIMTQIPVAKGNATGILGILGPMRQQYADNIARLDYSRHLLTELFS
ncbi:MAG: hypothetical protein H6760_01440 [Candidatus Nomurabacteria bacterium]|nr:MAG: hypothetical protein H6760_01440 [Candidatus Nomurabacteria bacterium]